MTATQRLRLLVWLSLAAYVLVSPLLRQGLGIDRPFLNKWTMFRGYGEGVCDVRYEQQLADGQVVEVDRFAALDETPWYTADKDVRRMKHLSHARKIGRRICRKLDQDERDLRLFATCGTATGWEVAEAGDTNLCSRPRKGRAR